MSNFSSLLPVFLLIAFATAFPLFRKVQSRLNKQKLDACNYVAFEALPSHLPAMQADLLGHRWRLVKCEPSESPAMLYRFEKGDSLATSLFDILNLDDAMPQTGNRTVDADFVIVVKDQGLS